VPTTKAECDAAKNYNCQGNKGSFNTKICMEVRKAICNLKKQGGRFLNWVKNVATGENKKNIERELLNNCVKICTAHGVQATRGLETRKIKAQEEKKI
jgi:hypothetical protein